MRVVHRCIWSWSRETEAVTFQSVLATNNISLRLTARSKLENVQRDERPQKWSKLQEVECGPHDTVSLQCTSLMAWQTWLSSVVNVCLPLGRIAVFLKAGKVKVFEQCSSEVHLAWGWCYVQLRGIINQCSLITIHLLILVRLCDFCFVRILAESACLLTPAADLNSATDALVKESTV